MSIYIITDSPFPIGMASTRRITLYAKGLNFASSDCTIVVTQRTEQYNSVKNVKSQGVSQGVKFQYLSSSPIRNKNIFIRKIVDFIDCLRLLLFVVKIEKNSRIIYFSMYSLLEILLLFICKIRGIKVFRELCELPYGTANDLLRNRIKRSLYACLIMPIYDGFIAISESLENYASKHKSKNAKIIKIPILIDNSAYNDVVPYRHKKQYIFHGGTLYERKDAIVSTMKAYVKAMKKLENKVDFILAGPSSPHKDELMKIISEGGVEKNVHFIGYLTHAEILSYQKGAILTILNKHDNLQNQYGFSTKLGDVLLAGTPVITTNIGEANNWLVNGESAFITEPHNIDVLAEEIIRALIDTKKRESIGDKGKLIAIQNFDYRINGERLSDFIREI